MRLDTTWVLILPDEQMSDSYFLLSGGAGTNVMHEQRAEGMLDALQEGYGVTV